MTIKHRKEIRFSIHSNKLENFVNYLLDAGYRKTIYSDKPVTQTIYFNHDKFFIPFNLSLKMRRYISAPDRDILIDDSADYILETKSFVFENDAPMKHKERVNMSGKDILSHFQHIPLSKILNDFSTTKDCSAINDLFSEVYLHPQIATQYRRSHFTKGEHLRVTIDDALQTFYFDENGKSLETTQHKSIPVEFKCDNISMVSEMERLICRLKDEGAQTALSKKNLALNAMFYRRKSGMKADYLLTKEFPDDEMESKYSIDIIPPELVFLVLRDVFEKGIGDYHVGQGHPFSEEIGSIHKYYEQDNNVFRIAYSGDIGTLSSKSGSTAEGKILSRHETKEQSRRFESLDDVLPKDIKELGELTRIRRGFWIENDASGRVYKIAVDNSYNQSNRLSQIELEYTGIRPGRAITSDKQAIFSEIETLHDIIMADNHIGEYVSPTLLTKLDWIKSLATR